MAKTERQKAVDTADRWFSRYIRISDKHNQVNGKDVYCKCITTGKYVHIKEIQCGHFIGRGHFSTRYDEMNAHPQSVYANKWKSGMPLEYRMALTELYGTKAVETLETKGNIPLKYSIEELRQVAKDFRLKTREIEKGLKIKVW